MVLWFCVGLKPVLHKLLGTEESSGVLTNVHITKMWRGLGVCADLKSVHVMPILVNKDHTMSIQASDEAFSK